MNNQRILTFMLVVAMLFAMILPYGTVDFDAADSSVAEQLNSIWNYERTKAGVKDEQEYLNTSLLPYAGCGGEWKMISLYTKSGALSYSSYAQKAMEYVNANQNLKPTDYERVGLAFARLGVNSDWVKNVVVTQFDKNGVMSRIYGLLLAESRPYFNEGELIAYANELLKLQLPDGGFALYGNISDVDVTAIALQALGPFRNKFPTQIQNAITRLSNLQRDNGGFASFGTENVESSAQVLMALCALHIDYRVDSRFIKNGKNVFDAILEYRMGDGSYCHVKNGGSNKISTEQVWLALTCQNHYEQTGRFLFEYDRYPDIREHDFGDDLRPIETDSAQNQTESKGDGTGNSHGGQTGNGEGTDSQGTEGGAIAGNVSGSENTGEVILPGNTGNSQGNEATGTNNGTSLSGVGAGNGNGTGEGAESGNTQGTGGNFGSGHAGGGGNNGEHAGTSGNAGTGENTGTSGNAGTGENTGTSGNAGTGENTGAGGNVETGNHAGVNENTGADGNTGTDVNAGGIHNLSEKRDGKQNEGSRFSGKEIRMILIGLVILEAIAAIIYIKKNKGRKRSYRIVFGIAILIIFLLVEVNIQSREEYYASAVNDGELLTRIAIYGHDNVILTEFDVYLEEGDNAFDQLKLATRLNELTMGYSGSEGLGTIYVEEIDGLAEFDYGNTSGWTYSVNGEYLQHSCVEEKLAQGDVVKWIYVE